MRFRATLLALGALLALTTVADAQARPPAQKTGPITIFGEGSSGPVSGTSVSVNGGPSRTLSSRFSDNHEAADYGATPAAGDIGPALSSALAQVPSTAVSGNTPVFLRLNNSGFYAINSPWTYPSTRPIALEAGWGVNYGGGLGFAGLKYDVYKGHEKTNASGVPMSDTSRWYDYGATGWLVGAGWEQTTVRQSHVLKWATGNSDQHAYTEAGFGVYALTPDLSLTLPYPENGDQFFEKDAIRGVIRTEGGFSTQAVGVMGRGEVATPAVNAKGDPSHGIAWGMNAYAKVWPGSEGYSVGIEINNENNGSAVKQVGGFDKIGLKIVPAFAGNSSTAAIYVQGAGNIGYYNGLWVDQTALADDPLTRFIKLPSLFEVMRDGTTMIGKTTPDATERGTGIQLSPNGSATFANYNAGATVSVDSLSGFQRGYEIRSRGILNWGFYTSTDGKSDLQLIAANDAGGYSSTPLSVSRSTGKTTVASLNTGAPYTPPSASSACTQGDRAYDASFNYVCVANNAWRRSALSSW